MTVVQSLCSFKEGHVIQCQCQLYLLRRVLCMAEWTAMITMYEALQSSGTEPVLLCNLTIFENKPCNHSGCLETSKMVIIQHWLCGVTLLVFKVCFSFLHALLSNDSAGLDITVSLNESPDFDYYWSHLNETLSQAYSYVGVWWKLTQYSLTKLKSMFTIRFNC